MEDLLSGEWGVLPDWPRYAHVEGAVGPATDRGVICILPARHHAEDQYILHLRDVLSDYPWVVLILTGDEEGVFDPTWFAEMERVKVYVQTPRADYAHRRDDIHPLPNLYHPDTRRILKTCMTEMQQKPIDVFFSGQVTHSERDQMYKYAKDIPNSRINRTAGFTQGFEFPIYIRNMAASKIALCPSGPCTPDTFRLYEALESGCIPIVTNGADNYWAHLFKTPPPFPIFDNWSELPHRLDSILQEWPTFSNECQAWWMDYKYTLAYSLTADMDWLGY